MADSPKTIARIDRDVFVGGYQAAADPEVISNLGITHIVKMFADDSMLRGGKHRHPGVDYLIIDALDFPQFDMREHVFAALKFIQQALKEKGTILVHCHMGISRSITVVVLHLMVNRKVPLGTALKHVKKRRPQARPNHGFHQMLHDTDKSLAKLGHYERRSSGWNGRGGAERYGQEAKSVKSSDLDETQISEGSGLMERDTLDRRVTKDERKSPGGRGSAMRIYSPSIRSTGNDVQRDATIPVWIGGGETAGGKNEDDPNIAVYFDMTAPREDQVSI